jgi:hypothetical protein
MASAECGVVEGEGGGGEGGQRAIRSSAWRLLVNHVREMGGKQNNIFELKGTTTIRTYTGTFSGGYAHIKEHASYNFLLAWSHWNYHLVDCPMRRARNSSPHLEQETPMECTPSSQNPDPPHEYSFLCCEGAQLNLRRDFCYACRTMPYKVCAVCNFASRSRNSNHFRGPCGGNPEARPFWAARWGQKGPNVPPKTDITQAARPRELRPEVPCTQ